MSVHLDNWRNVSLDCGCVVSLDACPDGDYDSSGEWLDLGLAPVAGRITAPCRTHTPKKGTTTHV